MADLPFEALTAEGVAVEAISTSQGTSAIDEIQAWLGFLGALALVLYPFAVLAWTILENCTVTLCARRAPVCGGKDDSKKAAAAPSWRVSEPIALLLSLLVWPCICLLPLVLTHGGALLGYAALFPAEWYDEEPVQQVVGGSWVAGLYTVKPLGLILGILAVVVGQVFTLVYHWLRRRSWLGSTVRVQQQVRAYDFFEGMATHLAQPEGFVLIGGYLVGTWMAGWMPPSYYSFSGGISWTHVVAQLLLQDLFQYIMHLGEHKISAWVYSRSHKPHHRFTNPRLFDAFNGSLTDTVLMIVIPFILVARLVPANAWSYMTFGTLYANWLVLIHSEFVHLWDAVFRVLGLGTAADHHVHHKLFIYNYGHLFMYWDRLFGTYRDPSDLAGKHFNKGV